MKGRERQFEGEKDILRQQFDLEMEQAVKKEEKRMLGELTKAVAEESYKNQQEVRHHEDEAQRGAKRRAGSSVFDVTM